MTTNTGFNQKIVLFYFYNKGLCFQFKLTFQITYIYDLTLKKLLTPSRYSENHQFLSFRKTFVGDTGGGNKELVFQSVKTFKIDVILDNLGQQNF